MTLSTSEPTDQALNATWPEWIRTLSAEINSIISGDTDISTLELLLVGGTTSLSVGTGGDLSSIPQEKVLISGSGPCTLTQITGGLQGQVKIFIAQGDNVSFTAGAKTLGQLYLNQPLATDFDMEADDVLVLMNVDGDGGSTYGYWEELYRKLSIR